jgi:hypothetical protein
MRHAEIRRSLYEYVRGGLDAAQAKVVEDHLAGCDKCYGEYQIVKEAIRLVPTPRVSPSAERSPGYWNHFSSTVVARTRETKKSVVTTNPIFEDILSLLEYRRPLVAAVSSVALLVVVSLLLVTSGVLRRPSGEEYSQAASEIKIDPVRMELADYYRKSKILLVGISNIEPESGRSINLAVEKEAAGQLVRQARYLDSKSLDDRSRALVRALERILIELANMEQQADVPDVEIVRSGIRNENMLFKIRMAESDYAIPQMNELQPEK